MVIYLRHDRHGTKVAVSEMEAQQDEKTGWERYELEPESASPQDFSSDAAVLPLNKLSLVKRGRPRKVG